MVVEGLQARAYTVPTPEPETDGTLEWDATTIVVVEARAGGHAGVGCTYGDAAVATVVEGTLAGVVRGCDVLSPQAAWTAMRDALRNAGWPGVGAMAVSAVDVALWDLKARVLGVALADLLGSVHDAVAVYGSGGFTSLSDRALADQLGGWAEAGMPPVNLKVGREPARDPHRLGVAREAIGDEVELLVDANGAFTPARALREAHRYATYGVAYLEEPVSSDDLTDYGACATARRRGWRSPRASTTGRCSTPGACSRPTPSTSCRPTSPAAAGSPSSCGSARSPRPA